MFHSKMALQIKHRSLVCIHLPLSCSKWYENSYKHVSSCFAKTLPYFVSPPYNIQSAREIDVDLVLGCQKFVKHGITDVLHLIHCTHPISMTRHKKHRISIRLMSIIIYSCTNIPWLFGWQSACWLTCISANTHASLFCRPPHTGVSRMQSEDRASAVPDSYSAITSDIPESKGRDCLQWNQAVKPCLSNSVADHQQNYLHS